MRGKTTRTFSTSTNPVRFILTPFLVLIAGSPATAQLQLARVDGVVLDARGLPVTGLVVVLTDSLGAEVMSSAPDLQGRFAFRDVAPGRYLLRAMVPGVPSVHMPLTVSGSLPLDVTMRLPARVTDAVVVEGSSVRDTATSRAGVAGESIAQIPVRVGGRGLQDLVATLPGWQREDNGLLHARGVDDGFLFVIDGVPVYERLDVLSGIAPELSSIESVNVMTGYVPPEFGHKVGGVIEVRSPAGGTGWTSELNLTGGSDRTFAGGAAAGGGLGDSVRLRLDASAHRSHRFLDPVHPDNLHNNGHAAHVSGQVGWSQTAKQVAATWGLGRNRFDVPHGEEQEDANQSQRQQIGSGYLNVSWQRAGGRGTVSNAAAYYRRTTADLVGSSNDTPIVAEARRRFVRVGVLGSVMHQAGAHLLKAGFDAQRLTLDEDFRFAITDEDEAREAGFHDAALMISTRDPFAFAGRATPTLWSLYAQDAWQASSRLTLSGGLRFDRTRLLLPRHQVSPRAGVSVRLSDATVMRGSVSRFFQPPQPENLLLSSSVQARALSPFQVDGHDGGADVEPERQWAYEAGVEQQVANRIRLDIAYWYRRASHVADPNVFLGTTLIFPNAVASGRAHGLDVRLELPRRNAWSAYASWSLAHVRQRGPITGGVFLEDEVEEIADGEEFTPDHDQRLATAAGVTWYAPRSRVIVSIGARFETGTPLQRDEGDMAELAVRPGADRVDFDTGRVKARTVVSLVASVPLRHDPGLQVSLRGQVLNLFNDAYAYNFGNPFSGTHFGAPRSASIALHLRFK